MPLDPLAQAGFVSALDYDRGRPGYAHEAIGTLTSELELTRSSRLLDLAAGTGQLARVFAPFVDSVVAVEPSEPMRQVLTEQGRVRAAEVLAGEAENLPLDDCSVDAIVVGQAFHWFDGEAALREMARVLRPHGSLALLWNVPTVMDPASPATLDALLERHLAAAVSDDRRYSSGIWRRAFARCPFEPLSSGSAEHVQHLDKDGFLAQIASWSYIAALPESDRQAVLGCARDLLPDSCSITFRTDYHWTRKR